MALDVPGGPVGVERAVVALAVQHGLGQRWPIVGLVALGAYKHKRVGVALLVMATLLVMSIVGRFV